MLVDADTEAGDEGWWRPVLHDGCLRSQSLDVCMSLCRECTHRSVWYNVVCMDNGAWVLSHNDMNKAKKQTT